MNDDDRNWLTPVFAALGGIVLGAVGAAALVRSKAASKSDDNQPAKFIAVRADAVGHLYIYPAPAAGRAVLAFVDSVMLVKFFERSKSVSYGASPSFVLEDGKAFVFKAVADFRAPEQLGNLYMLMTREDQKKEEINDLLKAASTFIETKQAMVIHLNLISPD